MAKPRIEAGSLDRRITIQQASDERNADGQMVRTWTDWARPWAQVSPIGWRDLLQAGSVEADRTTQFTIHWRPGVTRAMRILFDGEPYAIRSIVETGYRQGLEVTAQAQHRLRMPLASGAFLPGAESAADRASG